MARAETHFIMAEVMQLDKSFSFVQYAGVCVFALFVCRMVAKEV